MPDNLTVSYNFTNDPDDDFGWFQVSAEGKGFAGTAGFWVQWQNISEWAAKLDTYPLPSSGIEEEWGYTEDGTYHRVIFIGLKQIAPNGRVALRLDLRDYYDPSLRAEFSFETAYSRLAEFKSDVERLMARSSERATLLGD